MKILLVVSQGFDAGGAEKSVHMMKRELTIRGHEVAVLSAATPGRQSFSDYEFTRVPQHSPFKWFHHLFYFRSYLAMQRAVSDFRPDVIHFHTLTACTPSVLYATSGIPSVMTIHGPEEFTIKLLPWFMDPGDFNGGPSRAGRPTPRGAIKYVYYRFLQRPVYRLGLRRLTRVIAPSNAIARDTERDFAGLDINQIYNGIVLPAPKPVPAAPRLLFVGRLEDVKGVSFLIRAFASIAPELPHLRLRIVGEGPERKSLEGLTRSLGLSERIEFAGWVDSKQIAGEYAAASVLVVPSIWPENLPTVCIEAMAVGRPVIGTRTGGIPELINSGKTGLVVPRADVTALALAIRQIFTTPGLIEDMGSSAAKAAEHYSAANFINNIETLYREVASARTGRVTAALR